MSKIKTRETVRDIKAIDKSAIAGERMKAAFVRSKETSARLMDDNHASPNEYASDKVEYAAEDAAYDTGHAAKSGAKKAANEVKERVKRRLEDRLNESEQKPPHTQREKPPAAERPKTANDTLAKQNRPSPQEQGRTLAKKRAEQKRTEKLYSEKEIKTRAAARNGKLQSEIISPPKASGSNPAYHVRSTPPAVRSSSPVKNTLSAGVPNGAQPIKTVSGASKNIKQAAKSTGRVTTKAIKGTVQTTQKTIKTAEQTSRAAIKTTQATVKTTQQAAKASAKAAQTAAKTAKATAKAAATAAKATAKAVASAVKAIIAAVKSLIAAIAAGGWVAVVAVVIICLIALIVGSCFGIFFSSEPKGDGGQTMVEVVREINSDYTDKLDEIKESNAHDSVEMSGSRAVWKDVLAVYAVKTTTDDENGQEVATMTDEKKELLKDLFWQMNEVSYHTDTVTETVPVETDDGEGNIVTEEQTVTSTYLYILVAHKTAEEMAVELGFTTDQLEQMRELLSDEYNSMWMSVLYGISSSDDAIVAVALSQLGNVGGAHYWSWYGFSSRVEWCACFVSWCANECGYIDDGIIPKYAGCSWGSDWFKERGQWAENDIEPTPGMIIFFDWDNPDGSSGPQDGLPDHTGIVERVEDGMVYTVEGNSGDSCRQRSYAVGHYEIYGYGIPAY